MMAVSPPHQWGLADTLRVWPLIRRGVPTEGANFVEWCIKTMQTDPMGHISIGWWGLQCWMTIVTLEGEKQGVYLFESPTVRAPPAGTTDMSPV